MERAIGVFGLLLIGTVGVAVNHLPRQRSRVMDRAIEGSARAVLGAVGLVGWLVDRFSARRDVSIGPRRIIGARDAS